MQFNLFNTWVFVFVGASFVLIAHATDYCTICDGNIGCNNTGKFGETCSPDRAIIKLSLKHKLYILQLHNRMRNEIALGKISGYKPAKRMPMLLWDSELAYLAELNARTCVYDHDTCRATDNYPYAGQNLARRGNTLEYEVTAKALKFMITDWFLEYKDANMSYIERFRNHEEGKKIGHFTVMIHEKTSRVGCALSRFQERGYKYLYFVCNYSFTNVLEAPIYTPGSSCSNCTTGCNDVYKGLCAPTEQISSTFD